jgi:hypothetical protein
MQRAAKLLGGVSVVAGLTGLLTLACSDSAPSSPAARVAAAVAVSASVAGAHAPIVFNTQMRSELEVPACASESKGHAQIKVDPDGTIHSQVLLNNKGGESVRFGHIHHLNPDAQTGPIIWWLSSPVGTDLNLTEQHLDIRQEGVFVSNTHFTTHEEALAALLDDPGSFYVNFHSDLCPGGFARGFLP